MNEDDLDIPEFLKISAEHRKAAWVEYYRDHPARKQEPTGWQPSQVEKDYLASKKRDKALKYVIKEPERKARYAQKKAETAEIQSVKDAVVVANKKRGRPKGSKNKIIEPLDSSGGQAAREQAKKDVASLRNIDSGDSGEKFVIKKRRGRPPGSKNKPKAFVEL